MADDKKLVLGIFADEAAADAAVESLKEWDKGTEGVTLGPIGVLVVDEDGQIKEHKLGQRSGAKGAGIGLVLAVIAPPTLLAGIVGGGILGHFHHKGLGLTGEDRERIGAGVAGRQGGRRRPRHPDRGRGDLDEAQGARWGSRSLRRLGRGARSRRSRGARGC